MVELSLDKVGLFGDDVQSPVNLVKREVRGLQKLLGKLAGGHLGRGIDDPGIKKAGQNAVQGEVEVVSVGDGLADVGQAKAVVDFLEKEIAAVKGTLLIHGNLLGGGIGHKDILLLFFFLLIQLGNVLFGPFIGILTLKLLAKFLFGAEFLDNLGGMFCFHK